jgi:hypothetical protein
MIPVSGARIVACDEFVASDDDRPACLPHPAPFLHKQRRGHHAPDRFF